MPQDVHEALLVAPANSPYDPAAQPVQAVAPDTEVYVPAPHAVQPVDVVARCRLLYRPAPHATQAADELEAGTLP